MKFTPSEARLIELISLVGGTYCPGASAAISKETHRLIRKLERRGVLLVEPTDDGIRVSLREAIHA